MKTKSYKIYTSNGDWVEVSETQEMDKIKLRLQTGGLIMLNHQAWGELCSMKYELQCNEPGMEASQVPELISESERPKRTDTLSGEACEGPKPMKKYIHDSKLDLPMADETIKRLKREIENEYVATPEENKMLGEHEVDFVLPMADGTVKRLKREIEDV